MADSRAQIVFGIIGSGWRTEFFLRIAAALPERFSVSGVVSRRAEARADLTARFGVRTFATLDELIAGHTPSFVVVSVPREAAPGVISDVVSRGLPVLTETPPADDVRTLGSLSRLVDDGAIIQVAEQYHLQPMLRTQIDIAGSGVLGDVSQAQVSVAHDYHGINLIRRFLGIGFEDATITAASFSSPIVLGPGRDGLGPKEQVIRSEQVIARLDFGDRLGVYDFTEEQYRSWIRAPRVLVRGTRGEIVGGRVDYLEDFRTPVGYDIERVSTGQGSNLEGYFLRGLRAGGRWVYQNEFAPARLADDEIAIASCLVGMQEHVEGGPAFSSLADAAQDQYLQLMVRRAVETGEPVRTTRQAWAG